MNQLIGVEITVSGLVQGVGFRYYILNNANSIGVNGYVHNLMNGSVFIKAEGNEDQIEKIIKVAQKGPPRSGVIDKRINYVSATGEYKSFIIK